jgi:hypothetical protein
MTSFEAQVSAVTAPASTTLPPIPGSKKTPPPPPTKKTPPPPPAKSDPVGDMVARASQGPLVESGIINAPNSPLKLAATPEEAAAAQGIVTPSEGIPFDDTAAGKGQYPAADDLEALDAPQLKLLATSLGLEFLPRARAAGLRELIRNARATKVPADREDSREADILAEYEATEVKLSKPGVEVFEKQLETVQERIAALKADVAQGTGFDLYIGCAPVGRPYETIGQLIGRLSANFLEATGFADYRTVDWGKGPGLMAESIADELQTYSGSIVVDIRTSEGAAFCSTVERFAKTVTRSL